MLPILIHALIVGAISSPTPPPLMMAASELPVLIGGADVELEPAPADLPAADVTVASPDPAPVPSPPAVALPAQTAPMLALPEIPAEPPAPAEQAPAAGLLPLPGTSDASGPESRLDQGAHGWGGS